MTDHIEAMKQALEAYGATHREPTTGALYKKIDGIWYIWCRIEDEPRRWIKSLGTSESCLDPITPPAAPAQEQGQSCYCPNCEALSKQLAAQPAVPLTDEQRRAIIAKLSEADYADGDEWDNALFDAIEAAHGITEKGQP